MGSRRRKRSYGSGQLVPPRKPGGTWGVRIREGERRVFRGGLATREIAERVLAKLAGEAALGRAGLPLDPKAAPSLGVLAEPFLERRKLTHRAADTDELRWKKHMEPHFGHLRPAEVDTARIRGFVEAKLAEGLSSGTARVLLALLSSLFVDLLERGIATTNPARGLPRSVMRLCRSSHDPRTTPFIERLADVRRIYLDLPEPLNVAYAIGAFAGLRTGEVFALKWAHVDLPTRRIHVRESVKGPTKDKDSRMVPIQDALLPVLTAWKLKTGGEGLVIRPLRRDGDHVNKNTPGKYLRETLERLELQRPGLGWYEATRHTFASQWVMAGGSIEKLKEMMGHYSVAVTERYTHLRPDLFAEKDLSILSLDLQPGALRSPSDWAAIGQQPPRAGRQPREAKEKKPERPCKPSSAGGGDG